MPLWRKPILTGFLLSLNPQLSRMKFFKSHWSNLVFLLIIVLLIIPQTRKPIQVGMNRLFAFSPSEISRAERETISSYNWPLRNLEGERLNFAEAEGKVSLVNMWATWCPPCLAEMPSLSALYRDYGEKVNFYFISQEEAEKLQTFLEKKNYDLPVFQPLTQPPPGLEFTSLPTTYLISKSGEIVIEKEGAADWNSDSVRELIENLLND